MLDNKRIDALRLSPCMLPINLWPRWSKRTTNSLATVLTAVKIVTWLPHALPCLFVCMFSLSYFVTFKERRNLVIYIIYINSKYIYWKNEGQIPVSKLENDKNREYVKVYILETIKILFNWYKNLKKKFLFRNQKIYFPWKGYKLGSFPHF